VHGNNTHPTNTDLLKQAIVVAGLRDWERLSGGEISTPETRRQPRCTKTWQTNGGVYARVEGAGDVSPDRKQRKCIESERK